MKRKSNDYLGKIRASAVYFELFLGVAISIVISYITYKRIGSFGCGDECINYVAGHFLLNGKALFREIFFNHQPGPAYVSAIIQFISHPADLYHLVLYHRIAISAFSLMSGLLLLFRFRLSAFLFLMLYEGTKFYVYGYQFIGEAFIVYPLVYMASLMWEVMQKKSLRKTDVYAATVCALIVIAFREPYIPLAIVLLGGILWAGRKSDWVRGAVLVFLAGVTVPFLWIPLREYLSQVVVVNLPLAGDLVRGPRSIIPILTSVTYPVLVFVTGKVSYFRTLEIVVAVFFWTGFAIRMRSGKSIVPVLLSFLVLSLAGIRTVPPGSMYFDAFHMLPWYALFISITVNFLVSVDSGKVLRILEGAFFLFTVWAVFSGRSFVWERVDRPREFESQYAKYTHYSDAIKLLTSPGEMIFLDMWDDIIYWESDRSSSYPLQLYIPVASVIPKYQQLRLEMFRTDSPVVYYSCPALQTPLNSLPGFMAGSYTQLYSRGEPGCLYLRTDRFSEISTDQWQKLHALDFDPPQAGHMLQ